MKLKRHLKAVLFISLLSCAWVCNATDYEFGLHINTYPSPNDLFTGLLLEDGKEIPVKGHIVRMEFDLLNRDENVFGNVFRIITDKGDNIDLMYTVGLDGRHYPILVTGEYVHDIPAEITMGIWLHVSIQLNPKNGEVTISYDGKEIALKDAGTKGSRSFRIAFGHCPIPGYRLDDVASVCIRDIAISRKDRLIRHWDLSVHDGNVCFDNVKSAPAVAVNPRWLVDQYIEWTPVYGMDFKSHPSVAFDPNGIFYMTGDGREIDAHDVRTGKSARYGHISGEYPVNAPNQLAFIGGNLISYNLDESTCARLDFDNLSWVGGVQSSRDHDYWNNSAAYWENGKAIVSFGGYGHYRYNNQLVVIYPDNPSQSHRHKLEAITPRYGSASIVVGDTMFIYGGRGNLSGKQELSPKFYSDFYGIDLNTLETVRFWDCTGDGSGQFILGENMIYDAEEDCFYALASKEGGILIKMDRKNPGYKDVSLSCGFGAVSQYTAYNIFKTADGHSLYAIRTGSGIDGESEVSIVHFNWPPVPMQLLHQSRLPHTKENGEGLAWYWLAAIIAVICAVAAIWRFGRARKKEEPALHIDTESKFYDFSRNSICFFGGFCVRDRDGNDITSLFTPNLKALTLMLLLHSSDGSHGLSSGKLNKTIWSYKPEEAANNNRNVYISKLRGILDRLDGFSIVNKNNIWSINLSEAARCDWIFAQKLFNGRNNEDSISRLLELLLRGAMLPNSEFEWLDSYKGDFSYRTIEMLEKLLDRKDISSNLRIKVADTIFLHDFLNEDALKAKCRLLCKEGKTGLAKSVYDNFCKEYLSAIGMEYETDFKKIIAE